MDISPSIGALPGVYAGARVSSQADDRWIRPILVAVLAATALKLLDVAYGRRRGRRSPRRWDRGDNRGWLTGDANRPQRRR